jgi:hypothetical protein
MMKLNITIVVRNKDLVAPHALQVQYVECIATGARPAGTAGSLTLTGQVRTLRGCILGAPKFSLS